MYIIFILYVHLAKDFKCSFDNTLRHDFNIFLYLFLFRLLRKALDKITEIKSIRENRRHGKVKCFFILF